MLASDEPTYNILKLLLLQVPVQYNFFALAVLVLDECVVCCGDVGFFVFGLLVAVPVSSAYLQCS